MEMTAALGVVDEGDASFGSLAEHVDGALRCRQRNALVVFNREKPRPRIEQLDGVSTTVVHLVRQQVPHGFGHLHEYLLRGLWIGKDRGARVVKFFVAGSSGHEVHRGRPRTASETEASNVVVVLADGLQGVGSPRRMLTCRKGSPVVGFVERKRVNTNAATVFHLVPERWQGRQDVAEHDRSVNGTVAMDGLHRDVRAEIEVLTALPKGVLSGEFSVFGKVAPCLTHEPNGGPVNGLAVQSSNDALLTVHAVNSMWERASSMASARPWMCPSS